MIRFLMLLFLGAGFVGAVDEIRSYRVDLKVLRRVDVSLGDAVADPFEDDGAASDDSFLEGAEWLGPLVKKAGFESRFLEKAGELRDCSRRVGAIVGDKFGKAGAVYDIGSGRLIVEADAEFHWVLRSAIEVELIQLFKATLEVYEVPDVGLGEQSGFWDEVPVKAKLLKEVSWVGHSGDSVKVRTSGDEIVLESEMQWDAYDGYYDVRSDLKLNLGGRTISHQGGFMGIIGVRWAQELGSFDGKMTLMLVSRYDQIFTSGLAWADWVQKEVGGAFLAEERLQRMRRRKPGSVLPEFPLTESVRVFVVPPTLLTFLSNDQDEGDPFAADSGDSGNRISRRPIRELLEENGVTFREGDFAIYRRASGELIVKLSPKELELVSGIVQPAGLGPPEYWYLEMTQVEGEELRTGKVRQRMVCPVVPGQTVMMTLGADLAMELEMQFDSWRNLGELRMTLSEEGGQLENPSLRTGIAFDAGKPFLLKSEGVDGVQISWFVTARTKVLEEELDVILTAREAKK